MKKEKEKMTHKPQRSNSDGVILILLNIILYLYFNKNKLFHIAYS